ncbi:hypothetical protein [Antarcticirhabdus aurantiaca]|uniref:hypothetical protein n=1 Tax=Antarcticirhabdus aurantiaca TaxID=2606717 RepID=UPI00131CBF98|nr:hypothetical protein [Antarcticirhabdus aurantiaca]
MRRLGDPDPIAKGCGLLVVTSIRRVGKTRFAFAEKGERGVPAAVILVFGRDGTSVVDLAGWPMARPTELRTMFGAASMLGVSNVHRAATYAFGPLRVWRTALGWLRGGAAGAVILNPPEAARDLLDAPGRIAGEDHHHAVALAGLVASLFDKSRFVAPSTRSEREAA